MEKQTEKFLKRAMQNIGNLKADLLYESKEEMDRDMNIVDLKEIKKQLVSLNNLNKVRIKMIRKTLEELKKSYVGCPEVNYYLQLYLNLEKHYFEIANGIIEFRMKLRVADAFHVFESRFYYHDVKDILDGAENNIVLPSNCLFKSINSLFELIDEFKEDKKKLNCEQTEQDESENDSSSESESDSSGEE